MASEVGSVSPMAPPAKRRKTVPIPSRPTKAVDAVRITARLDPRVHAALVRLAEKHGVSLNRLIDRGLAHYIRALAKDAGRRVSDLGE